jgi:hypothetical protein
MDNKKYSWTELGMLLGIVVGSGLATILFATTGRAEMFVIAGAGTAIGLILGAGYERTQRSQE